MTQSLDIVVGIDVGGKKKGFHAVALRNGTFKDKITDTDPAIIAQWCQKEGATVVSVDAPCDWSQNGSSRQAERDMKLYGKKIYCFATPTREHAINHKKGFYDWVFNGEKLYLLLKQNYSLFKGERREGPACIETFPQAVTCALEGQIVSASNKLPGRRQVLKNRGYEISNLSNIDFIDAALCAVTAKEFSKGNYQTFGNTEEGFIVIPNTTQMPG
jgi:predicted nuclease with RNAse H fold